MVDFYTASMPLLHDRLRRLAASLITTLLAGLPPAAAWAFDLQGHRGARGLLPENSLAGFERAIALGATTLELDIAITRDGVLVIHHDRALNPEVARDASGRWIDQPPGPIHAMTWDQLQTYDIGRLKPGSGYASRYPDQQPIDGTRIPRLADLFARVRQLGHERVRFAIETKLSPLAPAEAPPPEAFANALIDEIRRAGMLQRVQILSFDWRTLQVVQRIAPTVPTVYLTAQQDWADNIAAGRPEGSPWTAGLRFADHGSVPKMIRAAGGHYWSVFHGDLDAAKVQEAHALGLKVLAWTVNDAALMGRLITLGVDGLITDRPDIAQRVLRERGIRPE